MKKLLYFLLVSLLLVSCEEDFDISKLQDKPRLVVYSFPTVGDTTLVMVTRSVPVASSQGDRYTLSHQPVDAHIIYKVNGVECPVKRIESVEEAKKLSCIGGRNEFYQEMLGQYYAIGKQQAGDNISVEVSADGSPSVSTATYIPQSVEVGIDDLSGEETGNHSVSEHINASFSDDGSSKDYYSVKVKEIRVGGVVVGIEPDHYRYPDSVYVYSEDAYADISEKTPGIIWNFDGLYQVSCPVAIDTNKDPVFKQTTEIDEDLGFDDYSYYDLAYIFDDHLFNGKKYTLHLNLVSTVYGNNFYYVGGWDNMYGYTYSVELYKLTPEYYRFLSTINSAQSNSWAEVGIMQVTPTYSNVKGGFGVVAGFNTSVASIHVDPTKKTSGGGIYTY